MMKLTICLILLVIACANAAPTWTRLRARWYLDRTDCEASVPTYSVYARDNGGCFQVSSIIPLVGNTRVKITRINEGVVGDGYNFITSLDPFCGIKVDEFFVPYDQKSCYCIETGCMKIEELPPAVCFSGETTVTLESGAEKKMSEVAVGDSVLTSSGFSEVYAFLDRNEDFAVEFKKINYFNAAGDAKFIEITGDHLILATRNSAPEYVKAEEIKTGDLLYAQDKTPVIVSTIETIKREGVYAPATREGTIVVNGVIASNYVYFNHEVSHMVLAPLRMYYSLFPATEVQTGIHPYASALFETFADLVGKTGYFFSVPQLSEISA
jgi:hypothetical protein